MGDRSKDHPIGLAFSLIAEWVLALGDRNLRELSGCWERQLDEQWWIALNGHPDPVACSENVLVPEFHAYIQFNGWPAGFLAPYGGQMAAGSAANEDALIEALRREIAALPEPD